MALAALLRSVASKMARAPPRHGPSATSSSRLGLSTGSTPPHSKDKVLYQSPLLFDLGSTTPIKKVLDGFQRAKAALIANETDVYILAIGAATLVYLFVPLALDRRSEMWEAALRQSRLDLENEKIKLSKQSIHQP